MKPQHGLRRVVFEDIRPQVDGGRHAVRRTTCDDVIVTAAIFADGKDELGARLHYRQLHGNFPDTIYFAEASTRPYVMYGLAKRRFTDSNGSLHFHAIDNLQLICYSKATPAFANTVLVVVNIDSFNEQAGWTSLDLDKIGCRADESFLVDDLLAGAQYVWRDRNYVALRLGAQPAHILRVSRLQ